MEWLQKILSNAVYAADGKLDVKATMKKVNEEAPKHIIPKEQYNGKVKELETANETIGDLKKNNAGNEELQKTIKTHEGTIKQLHKGERVLTAEENKAYSNDPGIDYNKMEKCMKSAVRELTLSVGSRELGRIIDEHLRERGIL